jgi:hypothetical protein
VHEKSTAEVPVVGGSDPFGALLSAVTEGPESKSWVVSDTKGKILDRSDASDDAATASHLRSQAATAAVVHGVLHDVARVLGLGPVCSLTTQIGDSEQLLVAGDATRVVSVHLANGSTAEIERACERLAKAQEQSEGGSDE